ncbi:Oidioi.mRNA.OKI2018_I69.PAR.g8493.t1.cds [Oikopleura dioica]|uniref:Oidioi.mRNA.OKI2018_I69.PAR.g8493.t1.cds n=1 Tax=Oikopleura dioica TaxID=34765 RepID=A0ABN7RKN7_OIKDI|nr:Oidioi.mRNA.OKI2018_I69.PAR.g8493.t1.cds [Oikopleura dioica]
MSKNNGQQMSKKEKEREGNSISRVRFIYTLQTCINKNILSIEPEIQSFGGLADGNHRDLRASIRAKTYPTKVPPPRCRSKTMIRNLYEEPTSRPRRTLILETRKRLALGKIYV